MVCFESISTVTQFDSTPSFSEYVSSSSGSSSSAGLGQKAAKPASKRTAAAAALGLPLRSFVRSFVRPSVRPSVCPSASLFWSAISFPRLPAVESGANLSQRRNRETTQSFGHEISGVGAKRRREEAEKEAAERAGKGARPKLFEQAQYGQPKDPGSASL